MSISRLAGSGVLVASLLIGVAANVTRAGVVVQQLDVDGKIYYDVRWGPVNQGQVVIFHNHGAATIPVDKLPVEYRSLFAAKPPEGTAAKVTPSTTPNQLLESMRSQRNVSQTNSDWASYSRDRLHKVVLDGKLVEKSSLKELTGFLIGTRTQVVTDHRTLTGAVLELATRRSESASTVTEMQLRPSLWKGTGTRVLLQDYTPATSPGDLIRVYAAEGEPAEDRPVYIVGTEPTFEQWQTMQRP
jgi:hypothetical protein